MQIDRLIINGLLYDVVYEPIHNNEWLRGQIQYQTGKIRIDESMPPSQQLFTLLHECIHSVADSAGLHGVLKDKDERVSDALASGVINLLVSNPNLLNEIQAYSESLRK